MKEYERYLLGRIEYAKKRVKALKERHGDNPADIFTYYGG